MLWFLEPKKAQALRAIQTKKGQPGARSSRLRMARGRAIPTESLKSFCNLFLANISNNLIYSLPQLAWD
jgi:hypothetical protein